MKKRTNQNLINTARQYPTRTAMKNADGSAYVLILRRSLHGEAFSHMDTNWSPRSDEDVIAAARKCKTRKELREKDNGAYIAIHKRNLGGAAFAHMDAPPKRLSEDELVAAMQAYPDRASAVEAVKHLVLQVYRAGIQDRAFAHMKKKRVMRYTDEELIDTARQYETRSDLRRGHVGVWNAIHQRKLHSKAYAHMRCGNERHIENRRAKSLKKYVGQTFNDLTVENIIWENGIAHTLCQCKCGEPHTVSIGNLTSGQVKSCPSCSPRTTSRGEQELLAWVQESAPDAVGDVVLGDSRLRWDVVIPSAKLAIEYNGVVWHSTKFKDDTSYHVKKRLAAEAAGYRQITVWEDEWRDQTDRMKALILTALGKADVVSIGARRCTVDILTSKEANEHHIANHVHQSPSRGDQHIGLKHGDALVAVATFRKTELVRYSVALGYTVPGGLSRLLKASGLSECFTYCDRDHFTGEVYRNAGFTCASAGKQLTYSRGDKRFSRYKFMKSKLPSLGVAVIGTEKESLATVNIHQCWNSGTDRWQWSKLSSK